MRNRKPARIVIDVGVPLNRLLYALEASYEESGRSLPATKAPTRTINTRFGRLLIVAARISTVDFFRSGSRGISYVAVLGRGTRIADAAGLTSVYVNRILARLAYRGVIVRDRRETKSTDLKEVCRAR